MYYPLGWDTLLHRGDIYQFFVQWIHYVMQFDVMDKKSEVTFLKQKSWKISWKKYYALEKLSTTTTIAQKEFETQTGIFSDTVWL